MLPKHHWSAFHGTYFDLATAYAARDLDYNLVIVADACTSAKREVHEQLMREVYSRLARVRSTIQVLEMLKP
jgi:nicotinamidase-related amidase